MRRIGEGGTAEKGLVTAFVAATLLAVFTIWSTRATTYPRPRLPRLEPTAAVIGSVTPGTPSLTPVAASLDKHILYAVAHDPFRWERKRPKSRFRSPVSPVPAPLEPVIAELPPDSDSSEEASTVRLLGIAVQTQGPGLAAVQIGDAPPRVLRVGERSGGFRLISVSAGEARLQSPDSAMTIRFSSSVP